MKKDHCTPIIPTFARRMVIDVCAAASGELDTIISALPILVNKQQVLVKTFLDIADRRVFQESTDVSISI